MLHSLPTVRPAIKPAGLGSWTTALLMAATLSACAPSGPIHRHGATSSGPQGFPEATKLQSSAAFGPGGRLWRVTPGKQHVYVDYSDDQGRHFTAPTAVGSQSQRIKSSGENRPGIAVDSNGKVFVIYTAEGDQPATIYYSTSSDSGGHFGEPAPVSHTAGEANTYLGKLRLDGSGKAWVFWHDERERTDWKAAGNAIYFTTIDNGTGRAAPAAPAATGLCECCGIALDFESGRRPVFVTRFVYDGMVRDHGLVERADDGKGWNTWRVSFDDWKVEACPEHGPALSIAADGRYHLAWFSQGEAHSGLFYAYSTDRGRHFSTAKPVGNPQALAGHPDVLATGQTVTLAWKEFDGVRTAIMLMKSTDGGEHWSPSSLVANTAGDADLPFLLSDGHATFLSWNTQDEGYRLIPLP